MYANLMRNQYLAVAEIFTSVNTINNSRYICIYIYKYTNNFDALWEIHDGGRNDSKYIVTVCAEL